MKGRNRTQVKSGKVASEIDREGFVVVGKNHLTWTNPADFIYQGRLVRGLREAELSGGDVGRRETVNFVAARDGRQEAVVARVQRVSLRDGSRSDHTDDLALHEAFRRLRILDLLA